MNYRNFAQMAELIANNIHRIPRVDAVVGIPRSGLIAASMIATLTNQPLLSASELRADGRQITPKHGGLWGSIPPPKHILLVDDSISGGETMRRTENTLGDFNISCECLAIYRKEASPAICQSFETVAGPRVFQWNWYRHPLVKRAVLDIDGVVCDEQTKIKNWDDPAEVRFTRSAALPMYAPKYAPLAYATGRKESERGHTEAWFARYAVPVAPFYFTSIGEHSNARHTKLHAASETRALWIVESDREQAAWLNKRTSKPVLCIDTNTMLWSQ